MLEEQQAGLERASRDEKYVPINVNLGRSSREEAGKNAGASA